MGGFDGVCRARAVAVAIVAAMLGGALLAPTAEADDGTAPLAGLTAPASEAVEAASEMLAAVPVDIEVPEADAPTVAEDAHPAEAATSEATAPAHATASEPETGNIGAESGDTSTDTGSAPRSAPAPAATPASSTTPLPPSAPEAAAPANVNISVRIDSAGDDGPVAQIIVRVAPSAADDGTSGATAEPARPAAAPPVAFATRAGARDASVVDWIWSCLGLRAISAAVSPIESSANHDAEGQSPSRNCGDNRTTPIVGVDQYRSEIIGQYRSINMNVSIRISSPGDNGPVSQTNVMVALGGGGQRASASESPAAGAVAIAIHAEMPVVTVTFASTTPSVAAEAAPVGVISLPVLEVETLELWPAGVYPRSASIVFLESDAPLLRPSPGQRWPTATAVPVHGVAGLPGSRVVFGPGANSTEVDGRRSRSAPADRRTTGPPRASAPGKSIVLRGSAPAGTSVAPASGSGSSGGGLPVFLLFPFIAVMLDLARRVVASRLTWPSGHRARMPDTPG